MRLLLKEQPYEKKLAHGQWRYEQDGQPTGATEAWRLTEALDGYRFLRIDLDGRASSGDTFLYTLLLNAQGDLEDCRWRFYNRNFKARGQVIFEQDGLLATRSVDGQRFEAERPFPFPSFFVPTATGLGQLKARGPALTLDMHSREPERFMQLVDLTLARDAANADGVRQVTWRWSNQVRTLSYDTEGVLRRVTRQDGLTAVQSRYAEMQRNE